MRSVLSDFEADACLSLDIAAESMKKHIHKVRSYHKLASGFQCQANVSQSDRAEEATMKLRCQLH